MKRIIIFNFLLLSGILNAQITIKGVVTEQNSGNKPIPGVQIKALGTAPELSDNTGLFQLVFSSKKPGDRIVVTEISKKGYEIVNKDVVNNWLIPNNLNDKKKIVMCTEGLIAQNTLRYYDISIAGLTKGYKQRIKGLQEKLDKTEIDAKTYTKLADSIAQQFDKQQKLSEELADKFARENFDDCSAIHQQAFEVFKIGDIGKAIQILETVDSEAEIFNAKKQKLKGKLLEDNGKNMQSESDSIIMQNIKKLLFQADMYTSEFRFQDAKKAFETLVNADTTNFENLFTYADFLQKQNFFEKAVNCYNKLLIQTKTNYDKARILNNLANLQHELNQYQKAEINFEEALKIRKDLLKSNSVNSKSEYASSLNNLALLQLDMNLFEEAEENFNRALNIYKDLTDHSQQSYTPEIAKTFNNLAVLYYKINQFNKAEINFIEAIKIRNELIKEKPKTYSATLANSLSNLAGLQVVMKQYKTAEINYAKALSIRRELGRTNPQVYNPDIAITLYSLAYLQTKLKLFDSSEANYREALNIFKYLSETEPEVYEPYKADVFSHLATLQLELKQFDTSESNYLEALKIRRKLAKTNPIVHNSELARLVSNIARLEDQINQNEKAEAYYYEALNLFKELAKSNPVVYNYDVALTSNNFATFYFKMKLYDRAEINYKEALKLYNESQKSNNQEFKKEISEILGSLSYTQILNKQFKKAESSALKGIATDSTQQWIQTNLAIALLFQGKYEEAKKIYEKLKDKEYPNDVSKTFKVVFLEDLYELEKEGITHPDVIKIRALLN